MDLKESTFDTGELRLHVMEGPASGPPLVMLHGATGTCGEWLAFFPRLAEHWHVYALDLRGHGLSGRPETLEGYHIRHNIQDTVTFLRERVREPAVLLGHSYGALISMLTPRYAPEQLRGIVLEDPPLLLRRENNENRPALDYFSWVYQIRQKAASVDEILALLSAQNLQAPADVLRPWAQSLAWLDPNFPLAITTGNTRETVRDIDFEAHIRAIACPVLIMQADVTKGAALLEQDLDFFMASASGNHSVNVSRFPGSGHGIHIEQPAAFLQAFETFAASLP
jgi:pimeloyl-ACP methyl ester carboxylesterase